MRHARRALLVATLLIAACGSSDPPRPDVSLLPAKASGQAGATVGFGQLDPNPWNLSRRADPGALGMSVGATGALTIKGDFSRTPPCTEPACVAPSANTWVRGYPNVLYGINQCHAGTSPPRSSRLPLPMRVDSIPPHLIGVTAHSAQTSQVTYDVAYDIWLQPTGTKQPCISQGTLEIMVWTDYNPRALLPASLQVGTASIPLAVDGALRPATRPWSIYASNIQKDGRTAPWGGTLWFVPDQADVARHGRVSVDLSAVFWAAEHLLQENYGWPKLGQRYWLDTASFGVEFGPPSGDPLDPGPTSFSTEISAYCLDVRSTVLDAACG